MSEHSTGVENPDTAAAGGTGALRQELSRKRQRLEDTESRHRAVSFEIAMAEAELQELEGGGFSGLLSRLKGNRAGRINDIATALSHKDMEKTAIDRELAALRGEVADL
jgi:hypothetical protein